MNDGIINSFLTKIPLWILLPFLLLVLNIVVGFNGLYGQDSFEYLRYSRVLHVYLSGGPLPGTFYWPILYPLFGALLTFILPDVFALQFVSLLSFALTIFYLQKILLYLYPEKKSETAIYLVLFFSVSPFVLRYASVVMSDCLGMLFVIASLYYYLLFKETAIKKNFILLILFTAAAVNTRYPAVAVLIVPVVDAFIMFIRKFDPVYFFLSLLAALVVFLPDIIFEAQGSPALIGPFNIPAWSVTNYFHHAFNSADGYQSYIFPNLCYVFANLIYPGFIFMGPLFIFLLNRQAIQRPYLFMTMIIIIVYALFIAGFPFQNDRILLLTFPLVILLFSGSFFRFWSFIGTRLRISSIYTFIIILCLQMALFYRAYIPFYKGSRQIREIASRMKAYPDRTIYTFNIDQGLKAYKVNNEIISLWAGRIEYFKPGSLVLFNYKNTSRQWENMNPMVNWDKLNKDSSLVLIENLPGNWNLYEIKN